MGVPIYGGGYGYDPNLQIHLMDLGVIATSHKVLQSAARTLQLLNITTDPEELLRTVKVEPVPESQVLKIDVISTDADQAEIAADVVASEFQGVYHDIMEAPTTKSREFIERRLPVASKRLSQVREALRRFKEQNNIVHLGQQSQIALSTSADYHNKLADAEVEAGQTSVYLDAISGQLAQVKQMPKFRQTNVQEARNPFYDNLVSELQRAELEKDGLKAREVLPDHPSWIAVEKRIAEMQAKLRGKEMTPMAEAGSGKGLQPLRDVFSESFYRAKANNVVAQARRDALQQVIAKVDPVLATLPAKEMKLAKLMVDEESAERTYRLLSEKLDEARIKENQAKTSSAITIIEPANYFPVNQKKLLKIALALLLSPMLSAAVVFLLNYLDNSVKTPVEAEELLGLPVFSVVPTAKSHSLVRHKNPAALAEIYQILSANLWSNLDVKEGACLLIASAEPNTGRSITASNLAVTLAGDGARVILVDTDLRQPVQHSIFGVENKYGLSNVLGGGALIEEVLRPTKFDGLLLMTAGPVPENPVRLLRSQQMKTFVEQITAVADFVIFDSPAGIAFADAGVLASWVKNVIIVHAAGRVSRGAEAEFQNRLDQSGANVIGAVLNMVHPDDSHGYFHYRRAYQDVLPPTTRRRELLGAGNRKAIATGVDNSGPGQSS